MSMKRFTKRAWLAFIAMVLLTMLGGGGCATTPAETARRVEVICKAAARTGTLVALEERPAWRPQFLLAFHDLDGLVNSGVVTGEQLHSILASLPVKELKSPEAKIAIEGALTVYDLVVGDALDINRNLYVQGAARGIRDGMKDALGL